MSLKWTYFCFITFICSRQIVASNCARGGPKLAVSSHASGLCDAMHTFESLHMLSHGHYRCPVLASCCEGVCTYGPHVVTKAWIAASGGVAMCKTEQRCPACLHQHADHGWLIMTDVLLAGQVAGVKAYSLPLFQQPGCDWGVHQGNISSSRHVPYKGWAPSLCWEQTSSLWAV